MRPADRERRAGRDQQRQHADGDRDQQRVPELQPEVAEVVVLLPEDHLEVVQRRMIGPELAGESRILRRNRRTGTGDRCGSSVQINTGMPISSSFASVLAWRQVGAFIATAASS